MAEMLLNRETKNELIGALADNYGEVSEHPTYLRTEGEGANFQLIVAMADGEMTISQDGVNHHLVPSSV